MPQLTMETRLATYGLDAAKLQMTDLVVQDGQDFEITDDSRSANQFVALTPKTINDVKNWIGVPDTAFAHPIRSVAHPHAVIPALSRFNDAQHADLYALSRNFVYGHSSAINAAQIPALNAWLAANKAQISLFHFSDITVKAGAKLTLSAAVHVLFARNILVEKGGRVVVKATKTKIDAASVKGE